MKIIELRSAIIASIEKKLPDLREVKAHAGRFNLEELKRMATKLPSVRVAVLGIGSSRLTSTEETEVLLKMAAFVVTADHRSLNKDVSAINIVEALLSHITANRFGVTNAGIASNVKADNLYAGNIDRQGVAIWAITWEQLVRTGDCVFDVAGVLPTEVYLCTEPENFGIAPEYDLINGGIIHE